MGNIKCEYVLRNYTAKIVNIFLCNFEQYYINITTTKYKIGL